MLESWKGGRIDVWSRCRGEATGVSFQSVSSSGTNGTELRMKAMNGRKVVVTIKFLVDV